MGNKLVVVLLSAVTLAACATEPDYYEGEIAPTRPIRKPSLDPSTPAELGGGQGASDTPSIFEGKQLGDRIFSGDHLDGRIQWAEDIDNQDHAYTYLHDVDSWTGVDTVTVVDEYGAAVRTFTTRYNAVPVAAPGTK
jgi:hypothetical protein